MRWFEEWEKDLKKGGYKYFVLKMDDLFESCSEFDLEEFSNILKIYNKYRKKLGKSVNEYWLVNRDENYADKVKEIIEENENITLVDEMKK